MTPAARVAAAADVLDAVVAGRSAEQALSAWARSSRFAGSKDRAALRDLVFDALRCKSSAAALGGGQTGRALMIGLGVLQDWDMPQIFSGEGHAPVPLTADELAHIDNPPTLSPDQADDLPQWLWPVWSADLDEAAADAAQALRSRAAVFLRVNQRRGPVGDAIAALAADGIATQAHPTQDGCLEVMSNPRRVKTSAPYRDGLVEVQDAASQLAVASLTIPQGARVLDYCAGGGGKSLAIADQFDCHVTAHDVDTGRMGDIPVRAARAGVQIDVVETSDLAGQAPFDVVVVDAPCSGSGTWRRNPEAKWALTPQRLADFAALQGEVLRAASAHVAPGGQLVYMTCSVFGAENEDVIAAFLTESPDIDTAPPLQIVPSAAADGFFCQTMRYQAPR